MFSTIKRGWRVVGTALSFTIFGIGSAAIGLLLFPLIYLLPANKEWKQNSSRSIIRWLFWLFIHAMRLLGVLSFDIHRAERLRERKNVLIVANHPTLLDVVFIFSFANLPTCIVKSGVWRNPLLHYVVKSAQFIANDGDTEKVVNESVAILQGGDSLLIFPEGTRTNPGSRLELKRGAAQLALLAKTDIVPITIDCSPLMLSKTLPWYYSPKTKPHFDISVEDDIELQAYIEEGQNRGHAARDLTKTMETVFCERSTRHESAGN